MQLVSSQHLNVHAQNITSKTPNMTSPAYLIPEVVNTILTAARAENQRLAVLTCGISGSGKSTLARNICSSYPNFFRLSIDNYVYRHHGVYDVDYPASKYGELQERAEMELKAQLGNLLRARKDVVLDMSFWSKEFRDDWRELVEKGGHGKYRVVLVVFRGSEEVLWGRIGRRKGEIEKKGEGMTIDRETLRMYLEGFEWPDGEGEVFVEVVQ